LFCHNGLLLANRANHKKAREVFRLASMKKTADRATA
jgi:hypothetical protein